MSGNGLRNNVTRCIEAQQRSSGGPGARGGGGSHAAAALRSAQVRGGRHAGPRAAPRRGSDRRDLPRKPQGPGVPARQTEDPPGREVQQHSVDGTGYGPRPSAWSPALPRAGPRWTRGSPVAHVPIGPPRGTTNRQLPTTNRHQPPTTNRCQPPAATNRQLPTTANRHQPPSTNHQPPITNHQPPPTTTNRHQPPVANCQPPTANRRQPPTANHHQPWLSTWSARGLFWENWFRNTFFFPLRTALHCPHPRAIPLVRSA